MPEPDNIVPPLAVQVTAVFVVFETLALKFVCLLQVNETVLGLTTTPTTGAAATVTVADAFFVASATLVAVTVYVPEFAGAVYVTEFPDTAIVPPVTAQVTAVLLALVTVAVKLPLALAAREAVLGVTEIPTAGVTAVDAGMKTTSTQ